MLVDRHSSRVNISELKLEIEKKIGQVKAQKYFNILNQYLTLKLKKSEFDELSASTLGKENISLHNQLIRGILKNATTGKSPPPNGYKISSLQSICRDVAPRFPRRGRTPVLHDRKSPLGKTHTSSPKIQDGLTAPELLSLGSRHPAEVTSEEDGEEVDQAMVRSAVKAPLGVCFNGKGKTNKLLRDGSSYTETCYINSELPDTGSLKTILERKLEAEGLDISADCVNLLNSGLDIYLKNLMKPCLELARKRSRNMSVSVSKLDFQAAMESNRTLLGVNWPEQLEKVHFR